MPASPVTIVTGGGRGIGAAICRRLAAEGHDVALSYVSDAASAEGTAEQVRAAGRRALAVRADVADAADVERLFTRTAAELGTPTGLVNNAGITLAIGDLRDTPPDVLRRVIDVNLLGTVLCCRQAALTMAGGTIVNISSSAANIGSPHEYVEYAAAKAGVDALTVGLAKELAPQGIRVACVAPGLTRTEIHASAGDAGRLDRIAPTIPLGRPGEPEEVAAVVALLFSADASYVTGAVIRTAGGR